MTNHLSRIPGRSVRHLVVGSVLLLGVAGLTLGSTGLGSGHAPTSDGQVDGLAPIVASREPVTSLEELTGMTDIVVVGRVVAQGATTFITPGNRHEPRPFAPQSTTNLPPEKRSSGTSVATDSSAPGAEGGAIAVYPPGMPVTRFTVQISKVLHGSEQLAAGGQVTVKQLGGPVELPARQDAPKRILPLEVDGDPLLTVGPQQHVLFLTKEADGDYTVAGGPDGRFALDAAGHLQPVNRRSQIVRAQQGETLDQMQARLSVLPR
jgi:hypothetical protein